MAVFCPPPPARDREGADLDSLTDIRPALRAPQPGVLIKKKFGSHRGPHAIRYGLCCPHPLGVLPAPVRLRLIWGNQMKLVTGAVAFFFAAAAGAAVPAPRATGIPDEINVPKYLALYQSAKGV